MFIHLAGCKLFECKTHKTFPTTLQCMHANQLFVLYVATYRHLTFNGLFIISSFLWIFWEQWLSFIEIFFLEWKTSTFFFACIYLYDWLRLFHNKILILNWPECSWFRYDSRTNPHATMRVGKYEKEDVVLMLPPEKPTIKDLHHFQVWCRQYGINFGEFSMDHAHVWFHYKVLFNKYIISIV